MWPELTEDVLLELKQLHALLDETASLREALAGREPTVAEKLAAASLLQSFYNGVERIFEQIAGRLDDRPPTGPGRHEKLLARMAQPSGARPAVVSPQLHEGLSQYLEFRNSYRYSHFFRLDWELMTAMVAQCDATLERLETELDQFARGHGKCRLLGRETTGELPPYWFAPPERARPSRWRSLRGPCLAAAIVGVALGVAASAGLQALRRHQGVRRVPPDEIRVRVGAAADAIRPWAGEPTVRHAVGVLDLFDADDWQFRFEGDEWHGSGDVLGRSDSLGASARLGFQRGELVKIELAASRDAYVFSLTGGRCARAAHYHRFTGRPQSVVEFDRGGAPIYISRSAAEDAPVRRSQPAAGARERPRRTDRFFLNGRAMAEAQFHRLGPLNRLILRTGEEPNATAVFLPAPPGVLARDPNAPAVLPDLPRPAQTQPGG